MPHPPTYYKWAVVMCCLLSALSNGISSLSCTECTASDEASCTGELETRERCKDLGIVYNRCKCCPQCGRKRGASCSDEKRCAPGLLCEIRPLGVGDDGFPETIAMESNVCVEDKHCETVTCPSAQQTYSPPPECLDPGTRRHLVDPLSDPSPLSHCCGWHRYECRCNRHLCPSPAKCPLNSTAQSTRVNGQCCRQHSCVNSDNLCDIIECKEKHAHCPEFSIRIMNKHCCPRPKQIGCICKQSLCPKPSRCGRQEVLHLLKKATNKVGACCDVYVCQHVNTTMCHVENGVTLKHMEIYKPQPCTKCTCEAGELVCGEITCSTDLQVNSGLEDMWGHSKCSWTQKVKGQCCPVCKGCWNKAKAIQVANGEEWTEDDGCTRCSCVKGLVSCIAYSCGTLYGCIRKVTIPGTCCLSCADDDYKSSITIKSHCSLDVYRKCTLNCDYALVIDSDGCMVCECRTPPTNTSLKETISISGTPRCRIEDGSYVHDGYSWNDTCHRSCKCIDGHKLCTLLNCPIETLQCKHPIVKLGHCCPSCIMEPESVETIMPEGAWSKRDAHCRRDTSGRGEARGRGVIFSVDSCTRCLCSEDGSLMCEERICPPLLCHRPVAVEGQCCPICQEDMTSDLSFPVSSGTCLSVSGAQHSAGSVWRVDFCTACYCDRHTATSHCFHRTCSPLRCTRPRYVKGQCCPQCMNDDDEENIFIGQNEGSMYYYGVVMLVVTICLCLCIVNLAAVMLIRKRRQMRKIRRMSRTPLHSNVDYTDQIAISFQASDVGTKPIYLNSTALDTDAAVDTISLSASSSEQSISKSDANLCDSRVINTRYQEPSGKEQLRTACAALRRGVVERTHSLVVRIPSVSGRERRANKEKRRSM